MNPILTRAIIVITAPIWFLLLLAGIILFYAVMMLLTVTVGLAQWVFTGHNYIVEFMD